MLKNYIKIAWRNLIRAKGYASLNIAGLAVGMAASTLIFLWIQSELQFDRFYQKTDRLFQVYNRDKINGEAFVWGNTPIPLVPVLKANYPDIEDASRYLPLTFLLSASDKHLNTFGAFADPGFFQMFGFPLLEGNQQSVLASNNGIVISKTFAERLFGTTDVIGKTIKIEHKDNFSVTGIMADIPQNSQFAGLDYILPWTYFKALAWGSEDWNSNNYFSFVLLKEHADAEGVNKKIRSVTAAHLKGLPGDVSNRTIFLHPAEKWHLYSKAEKGELVAGGIISVRMFSVIAAFILLIACVNFVNLSTARSEKRAKEVGIRKVAGAHKSSLVLQFISESVMLAFFSGILAMFLVWISLTAFNTLSGKQLSLDLTSGSFWLLSLGFILLTGLLAGSYPAFFLSNFQPVKVLKGVFRISSNGFSLRKGLVVMQFSFAIVLIISTLVIRQQIRYAQNRESGYNRNNVIFSVLSGDLEKHFGILKQELINEGAALAVMKSLGPITSLNTRQWGVSWPGSTKTDNDTEFNLFGTDADFLKTTGAKMISGREIDVYKYPSDSSAIVLNETAVKTMQLEDPLGTRIHYSNADWHVVGVVKDFIFDSPYAPVKPSIIEGPGSLLAHQWTGIRLNPSNPTAKNLEIAERIFKKYNPGYPFEYTFADDTYKTKFTAEQQVASLAGIFSGLTIFISCLGLFGLSAYTARERTKEIGVRKVLGASVTSIIGLLTKDFVQLMLIAFVLAAPLGWFAMDRWLQDYDYRIKLGAGVFLLTLFSSIFMVLLTVSFQAIKAALMNPVESLKSE